MPDTRNMPEDQYTDPDHSDPVSRENMEVNVHSDNHHKKKEWREYLLEFFMVFLAVTLGFFAESLREHISEKDRAGVFSKSLQADFKADTTTLHQLIKYTGEKIKHIDSIDCYIHAKRMRQNDSALYGTLIYLISTFQFDNINGTYDQLKSSGSLRFFDQGLVNSLNNYDATAQKLKLMEDWENKFLYEKVIPQTAEMFNYRVLDDLRDRGKISHEMYLRGVNETSADILLNQSEVIKRLRERQLVQQQKLLQLAETILAGLPGS